MSYAWYVYSHGWYREILAMLGFGDVAVSTSMHHCNHAQYQDEIELTTVVGRRT